MKVVKSKINWYDAIDKLSSEAYYMLSVLYYKDLDNVSDSSINKYCKLSNKTLLKYKNELINSGYLKIVSIGKYKYKYIIGISSVCADTERYQLKYIIDDMIESFKCLELREPTYAELCKIRSDASESYEHRQITKIEELASSVEF